MILLIQLFEPVPRTRPLRSNISKRSKKVRDRKGQKRRQLKLGVGGYLVWNYRDARRHFLVDLGQDSLNIILEVPLRIMRLEFVHV